MYTYALGYVTDGAIICPDCAAHRFCEDEETEALVGTHGEPLPILSNWDEISAYGEYCDACMGEIAPPDWERLHQSGECSQYGSQPCEYCAREKQLAAWNALLDALEPTECPVCQSSTLDLDGGEAYDDGDEVIAEDFRCSCVMCGHRWSVEVPEALPEALPETFTDPTQLSLL